MSIRACAIFFVGLFSNMCGMQQDMAKLESNKREYYIRMQDQAIDIELGSYDISVFVEYMKQHSNVISQLDVENALQHLSTDDYKKLNIMLINDMNFGSNKVYRTISDLVLDYLSRKKDIINGERNKKLEKHCGLTEKQWYVCSGVSFAGVAASLALLIYALASFE